MSFGSDKKKRKCKGYECTGYDTVMICTIVSLVRKSIDKFIVEINKVKGFLARVIKEFIIEICIVKLLSYVHI